MQLYSNKNTHFYSEVPSFIARIKMISLFILVGFPISELVFAELGQFYTPFWSVVLAFVAANVLFLIVIFKKLQTKKQLGYWVSILGALGTGFLMMRCVNNDFSTIILMEIGTAIIFLTFLFDQLYFAMVYLVPVGVGYLISLFYVDWKAENGVAYVIGIALLLGFFLVSYFFKLFRLRLLEFSENVLSGYDKVVVVFDQNANLIYINDYGLAQYGFEKGKLKYKDWWILRGYNSEEIEKYKNIIKSEIKRNGPIDVHELAIVNPKGKEVILEWNDQIIHGRYYVGIGSDVSISRKAEVEARKLLKVTQALGAGVAISNEKGQITWCNSSYAEIFEYQMHEVVGNRPSETFEVPEFFKKRFDEIIENGLNYGEPIEIPHYTKNRRLIWILLNTSVIDTGDHQEIIEVITDITHQKNNELQFKQTSLIAERTQTPVLICDADLTINWFNTALLTEFVCEFSDIIGNSFIECFGERWTTKEGIAALELALTKQVSYGADLLLKRKDEPQWYKISMDPIVDDYGVVQQYMIVMQNIQRLKDAQAIIELKNKNMVDSISYAKRIQSAFLPDEQTLKEIMPDHFFYYRPKDIVSGDFYYVNKREQYLYIAVADCTGHGVPGAMITSIGAAALNNAIFDYKLIQPNEILEHADVYVKNALSANDQELTDGMDLGILILNLEENTITFSGARRPLVYFDHADNQLSVVESQKRSIGEFETALDPENAFKTHQFSLDRKRSFYLFSDGIPDQFGGERHKRIGKRKILKIIEDSGAQDILLFKEEFESFFNDWTNNYEIEQTDDMLFFGMTVGE